MPSNLRAVGCALLAGLVASAACTFKDPNKDSPVTGGDGSGATTSNGGNSGRGGTSTTRAGSSSKGGSSGHSGAPATAGVGAEGGVGGEAAMCPGCASGFCLDDGTCVDCLPKNDHCPANQYCTDDNKCIAGCKTDDPTSCASGICGDDHSCKSCISDAECSGGDVCGNGQCGPACTQAQEATKGNCGADLTCCSLHCSDLATSSEHCGSCDNACGKAQFCGLATSGDGQGGAGGAGSSVDVECHDLTLSNVCSIKKVIVILDSDKNPTEGNRTPGRAVGAALESKCTPTPIVTEAEQASVAALNFTTGRPVSGGGELLLVAGGPFFQNLEAYAEENISPLYLKADGDQQEFLTRADDSVVVSRLASADNVSHDFFIIQFMRDPASGSLALNVQGFWLSGTTAASFYMLNAVLPNLSQYDKAWYAYEWTDMDDDMAPDLNEITLKASGS